MSTIMIVDDSEVDRRLAAGLLELDGEYVVEFASNGREALNCMRDALPDLILTDMQMPERDGLELVRAVRLHYSQVPVVLMTAHGSDQLAIQALEQGAAGYVPKEQLKDRLVATVADVLSVARADRSYSRLISCLQRTEFEFSLENDPLLLDPLVDLIQQIVSGMGICDATGRLQVGMALKAALLNALYRGNLEISSEQQAREESVKGGFAKLVASRVSDRRYASRKIYVHVVIRRDEAQFLVRDDGPGFDLAKLPSSADPTSLNPSTGRGHVLMRSFMDEVRFNDRGNEVTLIKRGELRPA